MKKKKITRSAARNARYGFPGSIYALTGLAVAVGMPLQLQAQLVPSAGDTVTVTGSTPIPVQTGNAITVPTGADGVTINNTVGGVISTANPTASAIETSADTTINNDGTVSGGFNGCLLYTSPSPRDGLLARMPSSA